MPSSQSPHEEPGRLAAETPDQPAIARRRLVLVGAGDMAAELIHLIHQHAAYRLIGILDPEASCKGLCLHGFPVIGWLEALPPGEISAVIGLPSTSAGFDRESVFHLLRQRGVSLPTLRSIETECHPTATLGAGTIIVRGCRIEAGATVGADCLLGSGCHIGPDCLVSQHTILAPGQKVTALDTLTRAPSRTQGLAAVIASEHDSIRTVIRRINRSRMEIVLVLDEGGALRGVITDGDIRRGILAGIDLDGPAAGVMNRNPISLPRGTSRQAALALMHARSVRHVPVVDSRHRPVWIESLQPLTNPNQGSGAVIMAGGAGTRLRPITCHTPKPLVPVAGRPILDHLLSGVRAAGIQDVAISVHYLADAVRAHVGSGNQYGLNVNYLAEKDRLGTAGALSLMHPKPTRPFLVLNGDVLTDLNFGRMLTFHREHAYDIVMCVRKHETRVPYGVLEITEGRITAVHEKPVHTDFINAGIYVLRPACLDLVPHGRFDMTDLVTAVLAAGGSVGAFPIIEYWCDIGTPGDLRRASQEQQNIQASVMLDSGHPTILKESA